MMNNTEQHILLEKLCQIKIFLHSQFAKQIQLKKKVVFQQFDCQAY